MEVRAKKALGQHFLTDQDIARRIVGALQGSPVLEVGPGMGVLTQYLIPRLADGANSEFGRQASGLASPDRSHPRLVRGRGPLAERVGGAERSEESGLSEPDASFEVVLPKKNGAGGVNGGITNGAPIVFRVAFKPTSSIAKTQRTLNTKTGETVDLNVPGRHDVCFALRTPVIVEAVAAIVLADLLRCQDTVLPRL